MQPNPNRTNRLAVDNPTHLNSYDPSAPHRVMMNPPPPPINPNIPANNLYHANPNLSKNVPPGTYDPRNGAATRIPRYYYPRYDGAYDTYLLEMRETDPYLQPIDNPQPAPLSNDPYASGPYYPNSSSYGVPSSSNYPHENFNPYGQIRPNSDVIGSHRKDADLSRLEVYHFAPKQNPILPPVVQYHVYSYPPSVGGQPQSIPSKKQSSYYYPQNDYQSDVAHYSLDPSQGQIPFAETKARSSQTDQPATKNRAVSPMYFSGESSSITDNDGYPNIQHKQVHTDRYNIKTGRINRQFYDKHHSSALPDCRCLDCQQERSKVLNYYPE
ncbi:unnamed protein product [Rotaria sp. Silwood1]|nr:unnamed protein product [Rotaria sp. Silwood1]CAF4988439.1 unnamed protein product [Rotaria sp. Silwood1]